MGAGRGPWNIQNFRLAANFPRISFENSVVGATIQYLPSGEYMHIEFKHRYLVKWILVCYKQVSIKLRQYAFHQ